MSLYIQIQALSLRDFRCYNEINWIFEQRINMLIGENGSGKTSILEALYLMAYGRSFRQSKDSEWVRSGCTEFKIHGQWRRYGPIHLDLHGIKKKLHVRLQGRKISLRKELKEIVPVVVNSPQGSRLIDGVHNERRKWLDQLVIQCEPSVHIYYQSYLRALMQRTRLLRSLGDHEELTVWEEQMVLYGRKIKNIRQNICDKMNKQLRKEQVLTEKEVCLQIESKVPKSDQEWLEALKESRSQDRKIGRCLFGSHHDVLAILYEQKEVRSMGSRGQQKLTSIAIKLAECEIRQYYRSIWPLLLLDDCFEALDATRSLNVMQRLGSYPGQLFMTLPNPISIPENVDAQIWNVEVDQQNKEMNKNL